MLTIHGVEIADTFAEAFPMTAARVVVTAETPAWARTAGQLATGYAASVIGCDAEAGVDGGGWRWTWRTPGKPGPGRTSVPMPTGRILLF